MTEIIIPIKELSSAKQRLNPVLNADERADLVLAMLQDLLSAVTEAGRGRVLVVASDDAVFDLARQFDVRPIREREVRGYNAAVSLGFGNAGDGNVAVLPGDLPLATADRIRCLCAPAASDSRCIRLAASHDQMGTNGLFLASAGLIRPGFGLNSLARYQRAARTIGVEPFLVDAPGLALDIDTPRDLRALSQCAYRGETSRFLDRIGDRLRQPSLCRGAA